MVIHEDKGLSWQEDHSYVYNVFTAFFLMIVLLLSRLPQVTELPTFLFQLHQKYCYYFKNFLYTKNYLNREENCEVSEVKMSFVTD